MHHLENYQTFLTVTPRLYYNHEIEEYNSEKN